MLRHLRPKAFAVLLAALSRVSEGSRLSEEVEAAFSRILGAVENTTRSISEIRTATEEQEHSTQDVARLLEDLQGSGSTRKVG